MSKKIKVLLLACILAIICCMGFTVGATDDVKAEVKGHSLTITDTGISVNFYVDIPSTEGVQVTLNENEVDLSTMETEEIVIDAKAYDCYIFTEAVAAKEMGDDVTLSLVVGGETVSDSYSVNDYVEEVQEGGYNYSFETLANAMTYYGEFAKVYFGYNGATSVSDEANRYIEDFKESYFDDYAASVNTANMPEGLEFYGTMLNLNSKTTLRLLFTVEGKEASSFGAFTANGEDLGELKPYKTYYYVDIEGIGAAQLDKAYTIKCGDAEIISNCSVLTYARAAVKSTKESLVNLSKALYLYNQKANTYVDAQAYAVYDMFYGNEGFSATPETRTAIYLTANGDVTRQASGNEEITTLDQLSGSRTKGASVWMETAYTVSGTEELTGPYVIRRYEGNTGNVLNVTGTATLTTRVDRSAGDFVAQYPGNKVDVTISELAASEVSASGTLNVTGSAKTGVITVASDATANIVANDLVSKDQVILKSHKGVNLSGNADVSAIKLLDDGMGHFDIVKHNNNVRVASVVCVCGDDVTGETSHEDCPWAGESGISAVYDIAWESYTGDDGMLPGHNQGGFYYLTKPITLTARTEVSFDTYVDLNGQIVTGRNERNIGVKAADYSIADSKGGAVIQLPSGYTYSTGYGGMIAIMNSQATISIYGGTIDMSAASTVTDNIHLIDIAYGGKLAMRGGTIIPAQDGKGIGLRNGYIVATGGTIFGEIIYADANSNSTITVEDGAQVGVVGEEGDWLQDITYHGINPWYAATLNCNNLNETAKIDLKSKVNFTLTENENSNSVASAITLLDDGMGHFDVVKQNGKLRFASVICPCGDNVTDKDSHICPWTGNVEGIASVYDINWQAHVDNGYMPGCNSGAEGYYYLTDNLTLTKKSEIKSVGSHLDLSGKKITLAQMSSVCISMPIASAKYAISDSDPNENGAIQLAEGFTSAYYGGVLLLNYSKSVFTMYGGTIDMSNGQVSADIRTPIELGGQNSEGGLNFTMYGGEIIPTKDGRSLYVHENANVSILGDAIVRGEINLTGSWGSLKFSVGDSAKVGLQYKTFEKYGIVPHASAGRQITCDNLNENANIVIKSKANLSLSEKAGSNSLASVFTVVNEGKDGHYGVVKKSDGTLAFNSVICVCGKNISDIHNHTCAWLDGTTNTIDKVYALNWQPWNTQTSKDTSDTSDPIKLPSTAGAYYLTEDMDLANQAWIGGVTVYLDLNGHKATSQNGTSRVFHVGSSSTRYSILDSSEDDTGTIKFASDFATQANGSLVFYEYPGHFYIYGGNFDMRDVNYALYTMIDVSQGSFNVHGGTIYPVKTRADGHSNCIKLRNSGVMTATGGTIYGEVILEKTSNTVTVENNVEVGLPMGENAGYGITAWNDEEKTPIYSNNVTGDAIIYLNMPERLSLSGTGEASAFEVMDDEYVVVNTADGLAIQKKNSGE